MTARTSTMRTASYYRRPHQDLHPGLAISDYVSLHSSADSWRVGPCPRAHLERIASYRHDPRRLLCDTRILYLGSVRPSRKQFPQTLSRRRGYSARITPGDRMVEGS